MSRVYHSTKAAFLLSIRDLNSEPSMYKIDALTIELMDLKCAQKDSNPQGQTVETSVVSSYHEHVAGSV